MKKSDKREKILVVANQLFDSHGFHAIGVDRLAAESGVTKRTLYKHFASKEGLIAEVLQQHHQDMMARTRAQLEGTPAGKARLLACFDLYRDWFAHPQFAGCIFVKTLNEFGGCSPDLMLIAREAKMGMRELLIELARETGVARAECLADQLQLILEGSIVVAQLGNGADIIDVAKEMAEALVVEAMP